ncbi:MAG: adenine phosphoribosyltransferase [Aquimonas sp.]|nr:adenine phosphoribosyltransferase [Aquimonas sp.]
MSGIPLAALVRAVPDFPKPGIVFRDVGPLLADAAAFEAAIAGMCAPWRRAAPEYVCGIESRGFIFGAAMARALGCGFAPIRKPGKLPGPVLVQGYSLEYGEDRLELQKDALPLGARVLLVDDVLATGGTLLAAAALLEQAGARLCGASVLIELSALGGRGRWATSAPLESVLRF